MNVRRCAMLTILSLGVVLTGCQALKKPGAKARPQERWDQLRGRVKYQLAEQQFQGGAFDRAARTATESLALDPSQVDAYTLLAQADLELGKAASAQAALENAARMGLASPDLYYLHGVILEQQDDFDGAVGMYSKARELNPSSVDYLVAQAEALVAAGRADEALHLLEENIGRVDDRETVSTLAGHVASLLGARDEAARRYADALSVQPNDALVTEELGRHWAREKHCEQTVAVLRPVVESSPEGTGTVAARTLAACYLALGDAAAAKGILIEHERDHPDDALAALLLAKAAVATDDLPTALRAIDVAQQQEPQRPELWFVRAVARWKRGNLSAAAADLQNVLQSNPDDVEAHCLLAEVLKGQSRLDGARSHFQHALSLDPDCNWAVAGLKALRNDDGEDRVNMEPTPQFTAASAPQKVQSP